MLAPQQIECTLVIPFRRESFAGAFDLLRSYDHLIRDSKFAVDVLLVDNSPDDVAERIESVCRNTVIKYAFLPKAHRVSKNQKMDAVHYALSLVKTDKVMLFDDDLRPSLQNVRLLSSDLDTYAIVKCIVDFLHPDVRDRIDLAGIFAYNALSKYGQTWGNISFLKSVLLSNGFPRRDVLFDELAIERRIREGSNHYYRSDVPIAMQSSRTWRTFINQRVRYAYENLAFRLRFACDLILLPLLVVAVLNGAAFAAILTIAAVTSFIWCAAFRYEATLTYQPQAGRVWPFAALWYWCYPICSWCAVFQFLSGGTRFQQNRIWRPV